jgi:hypothetical protein
MTSDVSAFGRLFTDRPIDIQHKPQNLWLGNRQPNIHAQQPNDRRAVLQPKRGRRHPTLQLSNNRSVTP